MLFRSASGEQTHAATDVSTNDVRIHHAARDKRRADRTALAGMQVRQANRQPYAGQSRGGAQLADGFAFDPVACGGDETGVGFSEGVHRLDGALARERCGMTRRANGRRQVFRIVGGREVQERASAQRAFVSVNVGGERSLVRVDVLVDEVSGVSWLMPLRDGAGDGSSSDAIVGLPGADAVWRMVFMGDKETWERSDTALWMLMPQRRVVEATHVGQSLWNRSLVRRAGRKLNVGRELSRMRRMRDGL